MKKLTAMIGVLTAVFMLTAVLQPVMGANFLQGYACDSYDDAAQMVGSNLYVFASTGAVSTNEVGAGFSDSGDGWGDFSYDATQLPPVGWDPAVPGLGEQVYFIAENPAGYVWAAQRERTGPETPIDGTDLVAQFESIPTPVVVDDGDDWVDLEIRSPVYTDYSWLTSDSVLGTYELFAGYRVYMESDADPGNWVLVGDTTEVAGAYADPIQPDLLDHQATDPDIVTGLNEIRADGLAAGEYRFRVSMLFDLETQGIYETNIFGEPTDIIPVGPDPIPEFGVGLLVPVVAIIGMFVAFTVYRRKRDE